MGTLPFSKGAIAVHLDPLGLGNAVRKGLVRWGFSETRISWKSTENAVAFQEIHTVNSPFKMKISTLELGGDSVPISV